MGKKSLDPGSVINRHLSPLLVILSIVIRVVFQNRLISFFKSRWSEHLKAERTIRYIFMQIKSSCPSVHGSGESAIASLVPGQGFVTLLGLISMKTPLAQSCWRSAELPWVSAAPLHPGPPRAACHRIPLAWFRPFTWEGLNEPAQEHL